MVMFKVQPWYKKSSGSKIYGAEWDGSSSPAWTRTDDAAGFVNPNPSVNGGNGSSPFDNILPWSGMRIVNDTNAGQLVEIPKFYYKWTFDDPKMKLQISTSQFEGSFVSPAHEDKGDGVGERNVVYVGRYNCGQRNNDNSYKSKSGYVPLTNMGQSTARKNIHDKLGSTIWQIDYAMYWTIAMLYLVEYANWDSQTKIGYGGNAESYTIDNTGSTDNMPYHTGTTATTRTTYGHIQYRYIEDLWANINEFIDGLSIEYPSGSGYLNLYYNKNPLMSYQGVRPANPLATMSKYNLSGWISKWSIPSTSDYEYVIWPTQCAGSDSTYVCDYGGLSTSGKVIYLTGYNQNKSNGLFAIKHENVTATTNLGCRLMKLP